MHISFGVAAWAERKKPCRFGGAQRCGLHAAEATSAPRRDKEPPQLLR